MVMSRGVGLEGLKGLRSFRGVAFPSTCARCSNLGDTALRRCAFPCLSVPGAKSPPRGDLSFAGLVAVESWLAVMGLRTGEVAFSCLPAAVLQLLAGEVALRPSETSPMSENLCPLRRLLAGTVGVDGAFAAFSGWASGSVCTSASLLPGTACSLGRRVAGSSPSGASLLGEASLVASKVVEILR